MCLTSKAHRLLGKLPFLYCLFHSQFWLSGGVWTLVTTFRNVLDHTLYVFVLQANLVMCLTPIGARE